MKVIETATTRLRELFGWSDEHAEYTHTWDEWMQRRGIHHVYLDCGGEVKITINHGDRENPYFEGGVVYT